MHATGPTGPRTRPRSRLRLAGGALLVVAALGASACSGDDAASDASTDDAPPSQETWSFTDDRGITHELDHVPERIVAQSSAAGGLDEYGIEIDGVFGPLRRADGSPDPAIGLADPDDFISLGEVDSQINVEQLAALRPEIIVTGMWGEQEYWGIDDAQVDELEQIAPIVGIRVDDRPVTDPLARFYELAESLGADTTSGPAADARAEFDAASTRLEEALAAKPELKVVAASGTPQEMYVAWPQGFPDLNYFQSLGMDLVEPTEHPTSGGFWQTLSWEEADTYPADLVLADSRGGTLEDILQLLPASARALPPIAAGQITSWEATHAYGYGNLARILDALTAVVATARTDFG